MNPSIIQVVETMPCLRIYARAGHSGSVSWHTDSCPDHCETLEHALQLATLQMAEPTAFELHMIERIVKTIGRDPRIWFEIRWDRREGWQIDDAAETDQFDTGS